MTYRGRVENGKVILVGDVTLPEGAEVEAALSRSQTTTARHEDKPAAAELARPSIEDTIARIMAEVPDSEWANLPPDLNDQLDHCVYGTPKE
jgi:hypothetical protein